MDTEQRTDIGSNPSAPSRMMTTLTNVKIFEHLLEAFNRDGIEGVLP